MSVEKLKKISIKSLLISMIISVSGLIINLLSYVIRGNLLIYKTLFGGEWMGQIGFGLLVNRVYPLMIEGSDSVSRDIWLSFEVDNFILTFVIVLIGVFVYLFLVGIKNEEV